MQQASPRMSSWVSLQQADTQTATNETESKSQTLNTIIFIKSSETNLSFQCWCRALSCCGLWSWNELIINKMQRLCTAFIDVNSIKFAYGAGIEERIYIHFAKTHLCGQV